MTATARQLYFVVVFWGKEHREYFLRLLAPSLLAPGNLPAIENKSGSKFLVCTTAGDWSAIQGDPDFLALKRVIEPVFVEIPSPDPKDNKYLVMSAGHKLATARVFRDRACGVFLTPDLVLADGGVVALQRLSREGKRVVLCAAMRYTYEGAVLEIEALRKGHGDPLVLSPRRLAGIALRHMHLETLRYDWGAPYFAEMPHSCFWRVPGDEGIVIHSFNWAPVLADYSKLTEHHTETFERSTMDADYICKNFGDDPAIHVVRDSDEFLLISFTRQDDRPGHLGEDALRPRWYNSFPMIGHCWKLARLRWLARSGAADPLKLRIFRLGVRMHGGSVTEACWKKTERRAAAIASRALAGRAPLEILCVGLVRLIQRSTIWPFSTLNSIKSCASEPRASNREFANQSGVGSYRVFLIGPPVSSGKWYWEVFSSNLGAVGGKIAETAAVGVVQENHSCVRELGSGRKGWGWRGDGMKVHADRYSPHGKAADQSDEVIMVALDMDAGKVWFGRNGVWFESGNPVNGANPAFTSLAGTLYPAISSKHGGGGTATMCSHVTVESWTYVPPPGFKSLTEVECLPAGECLKTHLSSRAV
jgi:hypothetical protein